MSVKLDLKHFTHVKSDDKTTTLRHKQGHELRLANSALSKNAQEQLKALRQGSEPAKMAEGGYPPCQNPNCKSYGHSHPNCRCYGGMAKGGKVESRCSTNQAHEKDCEYYADGGQVKPTAGEHSETIGGPTPDPHAKRVDSGKSGGKPYGGSGMVQKDVNGADITKPSTWWKDGGQVQKYATGDYVRADDQVSADPAPSQPAAPPPVIVNVGSPSGYGSASPQPTPQGPQQAGNYTVDPQLDAQAKVKSDEATQAFQDKLRADKGLAPMPAAAPQPPMTQPQAPSVPNSPLMDTPPPSDTPADTMPATPKEAASAPKDAAPMSQAPPPEPKTPAEAAKKYHEEMMYEDAATQHDLANGHITPKTYSDLFHYNGKTEKNAKGEDVPQERSTLGKIGMLFGMLVSGAGSGLSHQPDALIAMMNQQISNDLDAQQKSKTNAQNLFKMNQERLLNNANIGHVNAEAKQNLAQTAKINLEARGLTQMQMNRFALDKEVKRIEALPEGPEKQANLNALALMQNAVNNDNYNIAGRIAAAKALSSFSNGAGGSDAGLAIAGPQGEKLLDYKQTHQIPGVPGEASRPIPEDIRNRVQAMTVLDNKGKDVLNYVKQHSGTWNPQTRAVAAQKIEEMKNFYNDSIKGGALTQGRLGWYDEQFAKHPTDILAQIMGSTAKLKEMVDSNSNRRSLELKGLGFPVNNKAQSQDTQESKDKNGRPIIQVNGKWMYKK